MKNKDLKMCDGTFNLLNLMFRPEKLERYSSSAVPSQLATQIHHFLMHFLFPRNQSSSIFSGCICRRIGTRKLILIGKGIVRISFASLLTLVSERR